jgi:hypothetical protein
MTSTRDKILAKQGLLKNGKPATQQQFTPQQQQQALATATPEQLAKIQALQQQSAALQQQSAALQAQAAAATQASIQAQPTQSLQMMPQPQYQQQPQPQYQQPQQPQYQQQQPQPQPQSQPQPQYQPQAQPPLQPHLQSQSQILSQLQSQSLMNLQPQSRYATSQPTYAAAPQQQTGYAPAPTNGFQMPSLQEIRVQYPGFKSLVLAGAYREGGLQPDTMFMDVPASNHSTQVAGGPVFDFYIVDGGHTLVALRNGATTMTTLFSTNEGEAFHYVMSNGMTIKIDVVWSEAGCALRIFVTRFHIYDITKQLVAWHLRKFAGS